MQNRIYFYTGNLKLFHRFEWWEPDESRGSCPVLRGAEAEMPRSTHPYLLSNLRGKYFYLYLFLDIFSRKIVGFNVFDEQNAEHAASVVSSAHRAENCCEGDVTLHSDNGGPMKGSTMLAMLQMLGIVPSFSRPSVSDDNPFSESLFKTLKYCPQYPSKPFCSEQEALTWVAKFVDWYNFSFLA